MNSVLGNCILQEQRTKLLPRTMSERFGGKHRSVTMNHAYNTKGENATKPTERYPMPDKKDLPHDIIEHMEEAKVKNGFLPNVFKVMANRPEEFRVFFTYHDVVMNKKTGNLSMADKELIAVAVSIVNHTPYCVIAHSASHRKYSKKPSLADQVAVNWKMADLSDREVAMLEFALAVCRADNITEEHFQKLEAHGFDREDAWDIGSISAFFAMSNRIAHFTDLHPNPEFYIMGRIPREKEKTSSS
ncbi:uncharacterized protein LOC103057247 isoform X2 [Python bivittatus]|uniref:Uncharacterized protein LOC103057247 isoform X2 n=1 Tax=Python bivittatus TaxID=176946 RepID=A0A9F5IXE3_PYTBI|nr:uncharacterized protein LOC103057247 isoform X2 [Python bivittatus]